MSEKILVIDDEKNIRRSFKMILESGGYLVKEAETGIQGLNTFTAFLPDLVLLDIRLPEMDGIEVLREMIKREHQAHVVMISGHATVQNAVEATRLGAFDFIEKPVTKEKLLIVVSRALENRRLRNENLALKQQIQSRHQMIGQSEVIKNLLNQIAKVAPTNARVFIGGESGTGKELVARAIHDNSERAGQPFVKVNCAAIPEELIEAELFGSEKGAYTGSVGQTDGKFSLAHEGTLFLDEVGDMSMRVQAKVLRVLQEGEFQRVGGSETLSVDVRVISATNKNLEIAVEQGRFREDLLFRLNVVPVFVEPLRRRKQDIPLLVEYFIRQYCEQNGLRLKILQPQALQPLMDYDWPGNIRELQNLCERLVILSAGQEVTVNDLPAHIQRPKAIFSQAWSDHLSLKDLKQKVERDYILWHLQKSEWNITQTAKSLGIERTNLHKKMAVYKITKSDN
ncbi:sigma-54-dependent Fis family transcriptional regulator [candidate division KSB1 bacterium]|nr:sigma-54-dependent Fis family transcriptional regulator [candidate division KSB1 bacterium]